MAVDEDIELERLQTELRYLRQENAELRQRQASRDSGDIYAEAMENISEAVVIYDADGCLVTCNQNFLDLYGYSLLEAAPGVHFRTLGQIDIERGNVAVGDEYGDGDAYLARKAEYRRKLQGSFIVRLQDGRWIKTTDRPMKRGGFVSVQSDVTEFKRLELEIRELADHDPLTGLLNRRMFTERAETLIAHARRQETDAALLFIDLDGFKQVNDQFGHLAGDQVLQEVADRMRGRLRQSDLYGRYGGDEFLVLASDTASPSNLYQLCDSLIATLSAPYHLQGLEMRIGASIGISWLSKQSGGVEDMINAADRALYAAKNDGKGRWFEA